MSQMRDALGNLDDIDDNLVISNVFYDSYNKMVNYYKYPMQVWEETKTLSLYDTPANIGFFNNSDIIIKYDADNLPAMVSERIFHKNYSNRDWRRLVKSLKSKTKIIKQELGFCIEITCHKDYIDYIHYKEEWFQCEKAKV